MGSVQEAPKEWAPGSWRSKPAKQEVIYDDPIAFEKAYTELSKLPPLVTPQEILKLKSDLRECAQGDAFLLQGGDCAELFDYCNQDMIESKVKLLLQMSLILIYGARKKVVRVARMAGQYAKPRSSPNETINGVTMPSFRGDILNSFEADPIKRKPDPDRLVKAYQYSSATLNYLRASLHSGLADLHGPLNWSLGHVQDPEVRDKYQLIVSRITDTLEMMQSVGIDTGSGLRSVDIYSSHEGLLLEYETALTRVLKHPANAFPKALPAITHGGVKGQQITTTAPLVHPSAPIPGSPNGFYATSAHMLWIGDRTRQLTHAHVEYFRGIANPIGVKIGPTMPPEDIAPLLDILNPDREIGKIVLISRYGARKIAEHLPGHIRAVQNSSHAGTVVWQCDPMHGNGRNATVHVGDEDEEYKTRHFSDILSELQSALQIHNQLGSYLGGCHLELTGEAVTECVGGAEGLTEQDLNVNYTTYCDPRLNEKQALELAFLVARFYRNIAETEMADPGKMRKEGAVIHNWS